GEPMHDLTRRALSLLTGNIAQARERTARLLDATRGSAITADGWVREMDFAFLFDKDRELLRIGSSADGRLDVSYYDLLASESRAAVLLGIAKGDLPREAWFRLGRRLTQWRGYRCLISWSG